MNRFSLPRPDAHQCVAGLGFSALLLLASSANAAACRDITSVQQSADATRNTKPASRLGIALRANTISP